MASESVSLNRRTTFWQTLQQECAHVRAAAQQLEQENGNLRKTLHTLCRRAEQAGIDPAAFLKPYELDHIAPAPREQKLTEPAQAEHFSLYMDDVGSHDGAVYCAKFSPCGAMLASGSFDKRVSVWGLTGFERQQLGPLHFNSVQDIAWSNDSATLISVSLDSTAIIWDVNLGSAASTLHGKGMLLCARHHPMDPNLFFVSDSKDSIITFDKRSKNSVAMQHNDSTVYSFDVDPAGSLLVSGDRAGNIKFWDIRMASNGVESPDTNFHPHSGSVSSLSMSVSDSLKPKQEIEPNVVNVNGRHTVSCVRYMESGNGKIRLTANQGDQLLVYSSEQESDTQKSSVRHNSEDRGTTSSSVSSELRGSSLDSFFDEKSFKSTCSANGNCMPQLQLQWNLTGFTDKHFLIKSDVYTGTGMILPGYTCKLDSMLLATGSADKAVYLYDPFTGLDYVQKLSGHKDVVYGVSFHPKEPILASYSADGTVKVWAANSGKGKVPSEA